MWAVNKRIVFAVTTICLVLIVCSRCVSSEKKAVVKDNQGRLFAGSDACKSCHKNLFDSFTHTAHYLDSRPATKQTVKGSFADDDRLFLFNYNRNKAVVMEERDDGLYQAAYINKQPTEAHRFDMVIGSGRKGQSYLSWQGTQLFQLPISYFTPQHTWINSPGYPASEIKFDRVVYGRCLECHTTYARETTTAAHKPSFDPPQIIYGIGCERCHGAAAAHVDFHIKNPAVKKGAFITNPAALSRQQRLDLCGLCHSGLGESQKPAFSFTVADTLEQFYKHDTAQATNAALDVHGNQTGLLQASKCFINSVTLECGTCHNTHAAEPTTAIFSARCQSCHTEANHNFCKMAPALGPAITTNCIDCHMPVQDSKTLSIGNPKLEAATAAKVRSHLIAVYADATKKYLDSATRR